MKGGPLKALAGTNWLFLAVVYFGVLLLVNLVVGAVLPSTLMLVALIGYLAYVPVVFWAARRWRARTPEDIGDRTQLALAYSVAAIVSFIALQLVNMVLLTATGAIAPGALAIGVPWMVMSILMTFAITFVLGRLTLQVAINERRPQATTTPMTFSSSGEEVQ